jgi:hypothetical protein
VRFQSALNAVSAVLVGTILAGCGGGGGGSSAPVPVKLTLAWAARSRAISAPSSALSTVLILRGAGAPTGDFTETHNRQVGLVAYDEVWTTLGNAKVGTWRMILRFYSDADGHGTEVGVAQADVTVQADGTGLGAVTSAGAVATVKVDPSQSVDVGQTKDLLFTTTDARGNILAVSPGSAFWTSSDTSRLQFPGGQARGLASGTPMVTVTVDGKVSPQQPVVVGSGVSAAPNYVRLQSDPGEYIGAGGNYAYTQSDALIKLTPSGRLLTVEVAGNDSWTGQFQVGSGHSKLEQGTYANLERYPFNDPAAGGMAWSGNGRGSNTLTGSFTIDSATYVNGALDAIDLNFELHNEGLAPALHGQIHWTARDTTKPPGPVNPPPTDLWQPPPGVTPVTGDYVYLESSPGDYIGEGGVYLYTPANSQITVSSVGGQLQVNVNGNAGWLGTFQSMDSWLRPGYYGGLMRHPFDNPAKGGLDWSGEGRGSNTLTGWFVVDSSTYSGVDLTAIDLRFEQHSEGMVPALHGKIHWHLTGRSHNLSPKGKPRQALHMRGGGHDNYAPPVDRTGRPVQH